MKYLIYKGKIRDGAVGSLTEEEYQVLYDEEKEYAYLDPFPTVEYSDESYRISVNESNEIEKYFDLHDGINVGYLKLIQNQIKRGDIILDIGCGGGSLLDLLKGVYSHTIAVEPNSEYRKSLSERGHEVFADIEQCSEKYEGKINLVISNHVIEHVENPQTFIDDLEKLLIKGGTAFVQTPNYNDILLKLHFDAFAPFFFRKVHPVYLTVNSLKKIINNNNRLQFENSVYYHEFGLANTFNWIKKDKPCGHEKLPGINETADSLWRTYLESTGQTKDFGVVFSKLND